MEAILLSNHAQMCSWNQSELSNKVKFLDQRSNNVPTWFKITPDRLTYYTSKSDVLTIESCCSMSIC